MKYQLVFIGFGEAAYNISLGLASEGFTNMAAYDAFMDDPQRGKLIHQRAEEAKVPLISLEEACLLEPVSIATWTEDYYGQIEAEHGSTPALEAAVEEYGRVATLDLNGEHMARVLQMS